MWTKFWSLEIVVSAHNELIVFFLKDNQFISGTISLQLYLPIVVKEVMMVYK